MKKKIGVLTFHRSLNYGAILQAHALVKAIEKLGYDAEILDYRNEKLEDKDSIKRFIKTKEPLRAGYQILESPFWLIRRKKFNLFLQETNIGKRIYEINDNITDKYSQIIVGSDQVWNYNVTQMDLNYLLSNLNRKEMKNSYAASFGVDNIPIELQEKYKNAIKGFKSVSVREETGAKLVENLAQVKAKVVLDPSLLLNKSEWNKIIPRNLKKRTNEYIIIYQRAYSKSLIDFARDLAKKNNCDIITITGNPRQKIKAKNILSAGPLEWLELIKNSKYVVTNSFHGLAFSLNFNKEFFIELLDEKFGVNSRLENLIELFNLEDRKITIENRKRWTEKIEEINYKLINQKLDQERKKSIEFLKNSLEK